MKKLLLSSPFVILALTACGSASDSVTAPDVTPIESSAISTPASTPSAASSSEAPLTSDRGYLIKEVGQVAGLSNEDGDPMVDFVVTDIEADLKCDGEFPEKAENGHLIGIRMDVQTFKELNDPDYPVQTFESYGDMWKFISSEGTTFIGPLATGPAFSCLKDSQTLPTSIGPVQKASGWIVLDVPATRGTLAFDYFGAGGWEWQLGEEPNA